MSRIGVVIVAYRSQAVLTGLLESLASFEPDVQVVVVDNASPDGPPHVDDEATLLVLEQNHGFGTACNRGVAHLVGEVDYVCFLNPDVRLKAPSLTQMAAALDRSPHIGVATTRLVDVNGSPVPSAWGPTSMPRALWAGSGLRLPRLRRWVGRVARRGAFVSGASAAAVNSEQALDVEGHVVGGAMMVRAACWRQLGGFDEGYFMFWEDADLCFRGRGLGWAVSVLATDPLVHLRGASSEGVTEHQRWAWYVGGAQRFAHAHLGWWRRQVVLCGLRVGRLLRVRRRR